MRTIIVSARGLQLGYVGAYGNEWIETPTLDRLAAEGVVFDQHFADRPDAAGARRAWRSGRYALPSASGEAAPPAAWDLVAALVGQGTPCWLVHDTRHPLPAEFLAGWSGVLAVQPGAGDLPPPGPAVRAVHQLLGRLGRRSDWLIWLDLDLLLPPWELAGDKPEVAGAVQAEDPETGEAEPETGEDAGEDDEEEYEIVEPLTNPAVGWIDPADDETLAGLQHTYAAAVAALDAGLAALVEELERRKVLDQVMLLVTSDFGYPLGEHGLVGPHRPWLSDVRTHLPLLVRMPGGEGAGRRVAALTQAVDLAPTLAEAYGLPPGLWQGTSLGPLARGQPGAGDRPYAVSGLAENGAVEWAVRTPDWALLLPLALPEGDPPRPVRLFARPEDRWEVNDVRQHHLELAEHLEATLRAFVDAAAGPDPLTHPPLRDVEAEARQGTEEGDEPPPAEPVPS